MNSLQHIEKSLREIEKKYGAEAAYDFFSGFHDVIVGGESSQENDNPHTPTEQPSHTMYHLGARAAEGLLAQLNQS